MPTQFQKIISCTDPLPALLSWANTQSHAAFCVTSRNEFFGGVGAKRKIEITNSKGGFDTLEQFQKSSSERVFGYLGYDLKNDLEDLHSGNPDVVNMPDAVFFEPELDLDYRSGQLKITTNSEMLFAEAIGALTASAKIPAMSRDEILFKSSTSREDYIESARSIQAHLQRGDIYEANYCIQFSGKASVFDPVADFLKLQVLTEAPFSAFAKLDKRYILSASPERYLKNTGGKLISQPIKGTINRSQIAEEDEALKIQLRNDRSENRADAQRPRIGEINHRSLKT